MADLERIVAFLFTDVKGSVGLWRRQNHLMKRLLERHDQIIELAVLGQGGRQFKSVGDSCLAAFETASQALEAAQNAQESLLAEDWSVDGKTGEPLLVKMVVHCGAAIQRLDDYLGTEVNRTSRMLDVASPGHILVSKSAQQLAREKLPFGTELTPLGVIAIKDFGEEEVFELVATAERTPPAKRDRTQSTKPDTWGDEPATGSHSPDLLNIREFLQRRVDLWIGRTHDLDRRFTPITIRLAEWSCGEAGWSGDSSKFDDLWEAMTALAHRSVVLLGEPGSGKSTLLRHLDLVLARRRLADGAGPIPYYYELNRCHLRKDDGDVSALAWLQSEWQSQSPSMPPLATVMRDPGVIFLLDGLDELPRETEGLDSNSLMRWKRFVQDAIAEHSPCQVIISCRTQDYGLPLSTPSRAVPILSTEALNDDQISAFIDAQPLRNAKTKAILEAWQVNGLLRNPYTLRLALDHVGQHGRLPSGRAELFATLVRQVTRREIEREHPLFRSGGVLSDLDLRRSSLSSGWTSSHALPDDSGLFTALGELAHELAAQQGSSGQPHVGVSRVAASEILDSPDSDVLNAGTALGLLVENPELDSFRFAHLLIQSFLAARLWLRAPRIDLIERPYLKSDISPLLEDVLESLTPSDVLPPIPPSSLEDVVRLATEMSADPSSLVLCLAEQDLALAGRAVADPGVQVAATIRSDLGERLARRAEDIAVDLRARIEAAKALEKLGDPRFVVAAGEFGEYLVPPTVELPSGRYAIGSDERQALFEGPRRSVEIGKFGIGRFPVTVAEYKRFMDSGGYDDERWWDGKGARAWREGIETGKHQRARDRALYDRFRADPSELDRLFQSGLMPRRAFERWSTRVMWTAEDFDERNHAEHPDVRYVEPAYWSDPHFRSPNRPVVGVSWYEARAYCAWLSAQTGRTYRLPTELEIEGASRGLEDRAYPWGDDPPVKGWCNVVGTHIQGTTPVGVFPESHTPDGVADLFGNVMQWTTSAWGRTRKECEFPYPVESSSSSRFDSAQLDVLRVLKGESWDSDLGKAHVSRRGRDRPEVRGNNGGFRVAVDL